MKTDRPLYLSLPPVETHLQALCSRPKTHHLHSDPHPKLTPPKSSLQRLYLPQMLFQADLAVVRVTTKRSRASLRVVWALSLDNSSSSSSNHRYNPKSFVHYHQHNNNNKNSSTCRLLAYSPPGIPYKSEGCINQSTSCQGKESLFVADQTQLQQDLVYPSEANLDPQPS